MAIDDKPESVVMARRNAMWRKINAHTSTERLRRSSPPRLRRSRLVSHRKRAA